MHKLLLATPLALAGAVSYSRTNARSRLRCVRAARHGHGAIQRDQRIRREHRRGRHIPRRQHPWTFPPRSTRSRAMCIELQGATGIYDVLRNTAGVTRQQNGGDTFDQLVIRGIAVENRTNYRLNGSLAIPNVSEIPMENKERVEVLKGASALYYGFTTPAGIINLVTKRAGSTPVTSVGLTVDDKGTLQASTDIGRQFGDQNQFGVRINAAGGRVGSNIDGIDGNRRFVSAAFDWRVNSRLTLKADVENYRKRITEQAGITRPAAVNGVITLPAPARPEQAAGPGLGGLRRRSHQHPAARRLFAQRQLGADGGSRSLRSRARPQARQLQQLQRADRRRPHHRQRPEPGADLRPVPHGAFRHLLDRQRAARTHHRRRAEQENAGSDLPAHLRRREHRAEPVQPGRHRLPAADRAARPGPPPGRRTARNWAFTHSTASPSRRNGNWWSVRAIRTSRARRARAPRSR